MGKIYTQIIDTFNGGLSEDKRVKDASKFSITKHFDTFTYPHRLVPQVSTTAGINEPKTYDIVKFLYAPATSAGAGLYRLYGWGIDDSTPGHGAVYILDLATNPDGAWATPGAYYNSTLHRSATDEKVFFYYKNYIYAWIAGQYLCRYDTTGVADWDDTYYDATAYTNICQPVHHPSDDCAYFFHDNYVHQLNDTVWDDKVLTLPADLKIVAACPYGNYLAIACVNVNVTAEIKSIVYLWDRDSSLTTLTERIDFGQGEIKYLATLDNKLIAIKKLGSSVYGINRERIFIQQAMGQTGITLNEITSDDSGGITTYDTWTIKHNKLYFPMKATLNGDTRLGIWAVDSNGRATLDFVEEEATSYQGIYPIINLWFIAHSDDGSVNYTGTLGNYSTTLASVYESLIFNGDDSSLTKKLLGVSVMTEPLPADGQVILKYRKDEDLDSTWTTVFTNTTDDSISQDAINISGTTLPQFKEVQFRIESTGGAIITGLKFKYETIDKQPY